MLLDSLSVLPVCLSVTLVYCGQTVGWIKVLLGMEVGIDPSDTVLDGDPASHRKGHSSPLFDHDYCDQTVAGPSKC